MLKTLNSRRWRELPWRPIAAWVVALVALAWLTGFAAGLLARLLIGTRQ